MRKTVLMCVAFVGLMTMVAYGAKKEPKLYDNLKKTGIVKKDGKELVKAVELESAADSLSYVYGLLLGNNINQAVNSKSIPDLANLDYKEYMRGVMAAFETDTTHKSYDAGLKQGIDIKNGIIKQYRKQYGMELDAATLLIAMKQVFEGDTTSLLIPLADMNAVGQKISTDLETKKAQAEKAKGEAFLAEKEKEAGVVKTESGLLYKVVNAGDGPMVQADQQVTVAYKGSLMDGTEFDANESATFSPGNVIPGFSEGLQLMQKGGEYILYIPSELGYGERGAGGVIPGNAVLVFEVKVLDIQ